MKIEKAIVSFLAENFALIENLSRTPQIQSLVTELPQSRHKLSKVLIEEIGEIHNKGLLSYGDFEKGQNLSFQLQKDTEFLSDRVCRIMDILQGTDFYSRVLSLVDDAPEDFSLDDYSRENWLLFQWVTEVVAAHSPKDLGLTFVLGNPSGLFCYLLLWCAQFNLKKLRNFSTNSCHEQISERILNDLVVADWFFKAGTFDPLEKEYYLTEWTAVNSMNHEGKMYETADTIFHLSIEKLSDFHKWYDKIPTGMNVVLLGTNDDSDPSNILPMAHVEELDARTPKQKLYFKGEYSFNNYNKHLISFKK